MPYLSARLVGSPPPTRGAFCVDITLSRVHGITPAYAGSIFDRAGRVILARDHPRLRGEHTLLDIAKRCIEGSPPPTRGALHFVRLT